MTDIVVVDSGQVLETTESAIIAKEEADRSEQWAKYSEQQANLASDSAIEAAASRDAAASSAQSAADTVNGFDNHAAEKQEEFDANAVQKTEEFNQNATDKTQDFDANATEKTNTFNNNYTSKLNSFNTNASEKQALVDASANAAAQSETNAKQSEDNAEIWAEGTDEQVQALGGIHSSKGWADEATRGQIQADWNQTDDTQKDYIKNKPDVVHKTGDEAIDGVKTFLKRSTNIAPNIDTNVIPSSNIYNDFMISMDKTANNQIGYFGNSQETNGNILSRIGTSRRKEDESYIHTEISIGTTTDGTIFTRTPTPALSSNSPDIVNTSWFNKKIQVVSTLPSSPDANVFYFVTSA